jgi:ATP-dependent exoDNAse (exonuclease V) alpha subunit
MIKASGGECLYRKTDCAIIRGGSLTYGTENGSYRSSDVPEKLGWAKTAEERAVDASIVEIDGWEYHAEVKSSNDPDKVFEILKEKKGCCLTGRAGTGKTYLALNVAKQFEETFDESRVIKISFTNKASLNFGGTTIHKFLKMDGRGRFNLSWLKCLKNKNVLIICDEISMNPAEIWRRLAELKKALPNAYWLMMGDHRQCPPVEKKPINYFDASVVKFLCNNQRVELIVRQRYDVALWNFAEDVYERLLTNMSLVKTVKKQDMAILSKTTNICYFNRTRKDLNEKINQYVASSVIDKIDSPFESEEDCPQQSAILYVGLPIIAHRNFSKTVEGERVMMCANSETFKITKLDDELLTAVSVRPDEEGNPCDHEFVLKTSEFHKFFCLNYCSTTHKQQGATIDNEIIIFDYFEMTRELKYTALTRAKRLDQIAIFRS